jgi:hypothetical protein
VEGGPVDAADDPDLPADLPDMLPRPGAARPLPRSAVAAAAASIAAADAPAGRQRARVELEGSTWEFESGRLGRQADGSCTVAVGGTTLLAMLSYKPSVFSRRDPRPLDVSARSAAQRSTAQHSAAQPG